MIFCGLEVGFYAQADSPISKINFTTLPSQATMFIFGSKWFDIFHSRPCLAKLRSIVGPTFCLATPYAVARLSDDQAIFSRADELRSELLRLERDLHR